MNHYDTQALPEASQEPESGFQGRSDRSSADCAHSDPIHEPVQQLGHHRARTVATPSSACRSFGVRRCSGSCIAERAPQLRVPIRPHIEKAESYHWRRKFRTRGAESISFAGELLMMVSNCVVQIGDLFKRP
jgi:hypothetical protein